MLSDRTVRTVKATAPVLRERGLDITRRMYERLFLFNQSDQGEEGTQPRALASAVKRQPPPPGAPDFPPGLASNHLHDRVPPGSTRRVSAPAGDLFLNEASDRALVLLSGGVGLTPMVRMLDALVDRGVQREVWYGHAALSGRDHAMKDHVRDVAAAHDNVHSVVFYEFPTAQDEHKEDYDHSGRITLDWLKGAVPIPEADFYFCGPKDFMRALNLGLRALDVPDDRIHFEFFGPPQDLYA